MNDLLPPARRSIPDQRRDRMRDQLDAEMHSTSRRDGAARRFGIPIVAAVAVAALAIGGYVVASGNPSGNEIAPADQTNPKPPPDREQKQDNEKKPKQDEPPAVPVSEPIANPAKEYQKCVHLVERQANTMGEQIEKPAGKLAIDNGKGTTVVVANDTDAYTCNVQPDQAVSNPGPLESPVVPEAFAVAHNVTRNVLPDDPGDMVWAGGALRRGVTSVTYVFPDGHEEQAVTRDGYWAMHYFSPEPFDEPGDPIEVRLDGPAGPRELTLEWGLHTCNQVTHGC